MQGTLYTNLNRLYKCSRCRPKAGPVVAEGGQNGDDELHGGLHVGMPVVEQVQEQLPNDGSDELSVYQTKSTFLKHI